MTNKIDKQVKATKALKLANALSTLKSRIAKGEEFPDAAWSVAQLHAVNQAELEAAYDNREPA